MIRKTITIDDDLVTMLESEHITENYRSFSELVSNALKLLIEKERKEQYRRAMLDASNDPLYREDMQQVSDDFRYADEELVR